MSHDWVCLSDNPEFPQYRATRGWWRCSKCGDVENTCGIAVSVDNTLTVSNYPVKSVELNGNAPPADVLIYFYHPHNPDSTHTCDQYAELQAQLIADKVGRLLKKQVGPVARLALEKIGKADSSQEVANERIES